MGVHVGRNVRAPRGIHVMLLDRWIHDEDTMIECRCRECATMKSRVYKTEYKKNGENWPCGVVFELEWTWHV